jgi:hypothetical protein
LTVGATNRHGERRFNLRDLGVLEGPPLRGADIVVGAAADLLRCGRAAVMIYDDDTGSAFLRASAGFRPDETTLPLIDSIAAIVRNERRPLAISDVAGEMPEAAELIRLRAGAMLAVPVYGPDTVPVGILAALDDAGRRWTDQDMRRAQDLAYLASQEIMLRASFETLRILSRDLYGPLERRH